MRNVKKVLILALVLSALMCVSAFAAEIDNITDMATGVVAKVVTKEIDGEELKVAVDFEYTGVTKDNMYLVLILKAEADGTAPTRPTNSNILYVNQETAAGATISFDNLYPTNIEKSYIFLAGAGENIGLDKPLAKINPLKPAGFDVSGTVTSYLTGDATVELFNGDKLIGTDTGESYLFETVEAGTYTLKVSKANHVTREYEITVGNDAVVQNVKIHPIGDVNGDGRANTIDVGIIYNHARRAATLTGYELLCGNVVGSGTTVNTMDVGRVYNHARKADLMW